MPLAAISQVRYSSACGTARLKRRLDRETMHPTLSPFGNLLLAAASGVFAAVLTVLFPSETFVPVVVGCVFGCVAGVCQSRAIRLNTSEFSRAATALDVRRAFTATRPGKASILVQWVGAATILVVTLTQSSRQKFTGVFAGYFAFMFVRELFSFSATRLLQSEQPPAE